VILSRHEVTLSGDRRWSVLGISEVTPLKVCDIDSQRMVLRMEQVYAPATELILDGA
jgi:hypothetical protein